MADKLFSAGTYHIDKTAFDLVHQNENNINRAVEEKGRAAKATSMGQDQNISPNSSARKTT